MRRLTILLVTTIALLAARHAAAQPQEVTTGGWLRVNGPFFVVAGHSTPFVLGQAQFASSLPFAQWGDQSPGTALKASACSGGVLGCYLQGDHTYSSPGVYVITFFYTSGPSTFYSARAAVIVLKDVGPFIHTPLPLPSFSILSVGDSVASGEGNPEVPYGVVSPKGTPYYAASWDDGYGTGTSLNFSTTIDATSLCHRSLQSGPGIAWQEIRDENPDTQVSFTHLACTGATTADTIGQLQNTAVADLGAIDALLMTAGADDSDTDGDGSFGSTITSCLGALDCSADATLVVQLDKKLAVLAERYSALNTRIQTIRERQSVGDVYITQYYDPTRDEAGRFGNPIGSLPCAFDAISPREWQFLFNYEVAPLNDAVHDAAQAHSWHLVDGIQEGFVNHGYCAFFTPPRWVNTAQDSFAIQGEQGGVAHPNRFGQQFYARRILDKIFERTTPRIFFLPGKSQGTPGVTVDIEARNLAGAGAVRMEWTVYRDVEGTLDIRSSSLDVYASGAVDEHVLVDGVCDRSNEPEPVPCHSELKDRIVLSEKGRYSLLVTSYNAWGRSSNSTIEVNVVDSKPPSVTAPANLALVTSEPGGVRGSVAPLLAAFLAGGSATDDVDLHPTRLAPQVNNVDVDGATLFPVGQTLVTFRYRDASGKIGSASSTVVVTPAPDVNHDGIVDQADAAIVKASLLKRAGQAGFNPAADLNNDGVIDVRDVNLLLQNLNRVYPK